MNLKRILMLLTIFAVGIGALVLAFRCTAPDQSLWTDVGRGAVQLIVLVGVGGVLKILVDNYQSEQQQAAKNQEFRTNKYEGLVAATNRLRIAPLRVNPDGSPRVWSIRMRDVFHVGLDLRMIKHQTYSSKELKPPPFLNPEELAKLFELMYGFTGEATKEFVNEQKAGGVRPSSEATDPASPSIDIMFHDPQVDQVGCERDRIQRVISKDSNKTVAEDLAEERAREAEHPICHARPTEKYPQSSPNLTWTTYLAAEGLALERITAATLSRRRRWPSRKRTAEQNATDRKAAAAKGGSNQSGQANGSQSELS